MAGRIDPAEARTPAEFVVLLRRAAAQAHNSQSDRLAALLDGYEMPPEALVVDLLRACGMDMAQQDRWLRVYDDLSQWDGLEPLSDNELDDRDLLRARHRRAGWLTRARLLGAAGLILVALLAWLVLRNHGSTPELISGLAPSGSATPSAESVPSATPGPETGSPTPGKTTAAPKPASGSVTLADGQSYDLDGGGADLRWAGAVLHSGDNGKRLQLMPSGTTPTQQQCAALIPGQLDRSVSGLSAGRSVCVRTTQNHWARITVTSAGSSLGFNFVVFT